MPPWLPALSIFGPVNTLANRIADVIGPLDLTADQNVILLHADLSAAATLAGIDRYWIVRWINHGSPGTDFCVNLESDPANSFPGTLVNQHCQPRASISGVAELAGILALWIPGLLP